MWSLTLSAQSHGRQSRQHGWDPELAHRERSLPTGHGPDHTPASRTLTALLLQAGPSEGLGQSSSWSPGLANDNQEARTHARKHTCYHAASSRAGTGPRPAHPKVPFLILKGRTWRGSLWKLLEACSAGAEGECTLA